MVDRSLGSERWPSTSEPSWDGSLSGTVPGTVDVEVVDKGNDNEGTSTEFAVGIVDGAGNVNFAGSRRIATNPTAGAMVQSFSVNVASHDTTVRLDGEPQKVVLVARNTRPGRQGLITEAAIGPDGSVDSGGSVSPRDPLPGFEAGRGNPGADEVDIDPSNYAGIVNADNEQGVALAPALRREGASLGPDGATVNLPDGRTVEVGAISDPDEVARVIDGENVGDVIDADQPATESGGTSESGDLGPAAAVVGVLVLGYAATQL